MNAILRLYRLLNLLSVDVALGTVCCALFFSRLFRVTVLPVGLASLGLTVWIIYTTDHLLDAKKVKATASTHRHRFHQKYFHVLFGVVIVASLVNAILIFFIRKPVFWAGVVLAGCVGLYLLANRFLKFPKEFVIAFMYTMGVLLPSASVTSFPFRQWPWIVILQFMLTALMNLVLFAWFDAESDYRDGSTSFVTRMGKQNGARFIWLLLAINIILAAIFFSGSATILLLLMNASLIVIFTARNFFSIDERFRIGDAIFFLPLFYYWM